MKLRYALGVLVIAAIAACNLPGSTSAQQSTIGNTGTITANGGSVGVGQGFGTAPLNGQNCSVDISGTWTGTLAFQLAQQSHTFYAAATYVTSNPSPTTSNELVAVTTQGATSFQVIATATMTGTANVTIYCSQGAPINGNGGGGGSIPNPLNVNVSNTPAPVNVQASPTTPPATAQLNVAITACIAGATPAPTSGQFVQQQCNAQGHMIVGIEPNTAISIGGTCYICLTPQPQLVLTSAATQTCTAISTTAGLLENVQSSNAAAQTATITFFQDNGTCAAGDNVYAITLGIQQVVTWGLGLYSSAGWSYTLSGAPVNNISVGYSH